MNALWNAVESAWIVALLMLLSAVFICFLIQLVCRRRLPWSFKARVSWVCDGDSIWVKRSFGRKVKLRLRGIDAPETEQSYGRESREVLSEMISGRAVSVVVYEWDRYGRGVASVHCSGRDVCLAMIEEGAAWPYYGYLNRTPGKIREAYARAGESAKRRAAGLWSEKNPEAPWDWRARHRSLWSRILYWIGRLFRKIFSR